jgi:hypothetical protein
LLHLAIALSQTGVALSTSLRRDDAVDVFRYTINTRGMINTTNGENEDRIPPGETRTISAIPPINAQSPADTIEPVPHGLLYTGLEGGRSFQFCDAIPLTLCTWSER